MTSRGQRRSRTPARAPRPALANTPAPCAPAWPELHNMPPPDRSFAGRRGEKGVFQGPEHSSTCLQCLNQVGYNSPRKETTKMDPPGKTVKEVITGCQIVNKEERKEAIQSPGKTSTTRKISAPTSRLSKLPKHRGSRSEVS